PGGRICASSGVLLENLDLSRRAPGHEAGRRGARSPPVASVGRHPRRLTTRRTPASLLSHPYGDEQFRPQPRDGSLYPHLAWDPQDDAAFFLRKRPPGFFRDPRTGRAGKGAVTRCWRLIWALAWVPHGNGSIRALIDATRGNILPIWRPGQWANRGGR